MDINIAFPVIFIAVALLLGILVAKSGFFTRNRNETDDPRRGLKPNNTNYNMSTFSEKELKNMTKAEAKTFLQQVEKGELTSLSPRDFAALKEKIEG